ncbi:MAG: porin [Bauldia sp.]|nr:porin [Bauldia sp.]
MLRMILVTFPLLAAVAVASADEIDVLPPDIFDVPHDRAAVEDDNSSGEAQAVPTYCDRYGPGYEQVPGTTTCIKASGYFSVDVYSRSHRR